MLAVGGRTTAEVTVRDRVSVEPLPTLHGERVTVRPVAEPDVARLDEIALEPSVARWWPLPEGESIRRDLFEPGANSFAIVVDGEIAGLIMFAEQNAPDYRSASIDIALSSEYQGLGLGPEALRVLIGYLVGDRGHHRLTIDPAVTNEHAIRAYEGVGFKPVGVMRAYERGGDGTWHDNLLMDLLAEEFVGR